MIVVLTRFAYLPNCTLGTLDVDHLTLATIELPLVPEPSGPGGKRRMSCVPDGTYALRSHTSKHFPRTYALVNPTLGVWYQPYEVPARQAWGRSAILIHVANRTSDIVGCIGIGLRHSFGADPLVVESRAAMDKLREVLGTDTHTLEIKPAGTHEGI